MLISYVDKTDENLCITKKAVTKWKKKTCSTNKYIQKI